MSFVAFKSLAEWKEHYRENPPRTIVTIGNFDGVHLGHQEILRRLVERARQEIARSVVVTFDPHPLRFLRPSDAPALLLTMTQRLAAFAEAGVDAALVLHFDRALSELTPEEFVRRILVDTLHAQTVLVGENFRFGHRGAGDVTLLRKLGALPHPVGGDRQQPHSFTVECIEPVVYRGVTVSSTAIRDAIRAGDVSLAARLLGRPYALAGSVVSGDARGRHVTVPTLNLQTSQEVLPQLGVYATEVSLNPRATPETANTDISSDTQTYRAVTNVGTRPTFNGQNISIESHLFDFHQQIDSGPLEVRFCKKLRNEIKFSSPDALRAQIQIDARRARHFFAIFDKLLTRPAPK